MSVGLFFIVGASLLLHMVLYAESFVWVPRHTKDTLFVSAVSALFAFINAIYMGLPQKMHHILRAKY